MLYLAFSLCVKATIVVVVGILWATYNNVKKPVSAKTGGRKKRFIFIPVVFYNEKSQF